jgi:small subunit ribosomal protein S2
LFVGTKKQAKAIVEAEATRCSMPYVTSRWLGGILTNFPTIKRNIDLLIQLRKQREEGYFARLSKKDAKHLQRKLERLQVHFAGLVGLDRLPACLYVVDPKREQNTVHEANRLKIPIVAICDTNTDPELITYPIPGNDDAIRSVRLITSLVGESVLAGRQRAGLVSPVESPAASGTSNGASAESSPASPEAGDASGPTNEPENPA